MCRSDKRAGVSHDDQLLAARAFRLTGLLFWWSKAVSNDFERQFSGTNSLPDSFLIEVALYRRLVDAICRQIGILRFRNG